MKVKHRVLHWLLCGALLLGQLPAGAFAAFDGGGGSAQPQEEDISSGVNLLAGELDFSSSSGEGNLDTDGYKWDNVQYDGNDDISSGTLTLASGFSASKIILPDAAITIVTQPGDASIGEIGFPSDPSYSSGPYKAKLTFSGEGTLTIEKLLNLDGGDGNSLTIEEGAHVIAKRGVSGGASGGINFPVVVNGTLEAIDTGDRSAALSGGTVTIGDTGVLEVSGTNGVRLNGMNPGNSGTIFDDSFTVTGDGRFTANCTDYNLMVASPSGTLPEGTQPKKVINLTEEYLPDNCDIAFIDGGTVYLVKKNDSGTYGNDDIHKGPLTIHRLHDFQPPWVSDATDHWQQCRFAGCGAIGEKAAHVYDNNRDTDCNFCGYTRTLPTHTHSWATAWDYDGSCHWHNCTAPDCDITDDSQKDGYAVHSYSGWSADDNNHWQICAVCGRETAHAPHVYTNDRDTTCNICGHVRTVTHIHSWAAVWSRNSTHHWNECTAEGCDITDDSRKNGYSAHVYDDEQDTVCNTCGYVRSLTPSPHTHIWDSEWVSSGSHHWHRCVAPGCDITDNSQKGSYGPHRYGSEWDADADSHWRTCLDCGYETAHGSHDYSDEQDTVCNTCGYVRTAAHSHNWSAAWNHNNTHHWHECSAEGCDITDNSRKDGYSAHVYDGERDTDCNTCGYVRTLTPPDAGSDSGSGSGSDSFERKKRSGSSSTVRDSYPIIVEDAAHGEVTSDRDTASRGDTVTLTVIPENGYALGVLIVTDSRENSVAFAEREDGSYTFAMPGSAVTVKSSFAPLPGLGTQPCDGGADCPSRGFSDLGRAGTWYHEAVDYVLRSRLMDGYGSGLFGPEDTLTRAQFAQILCNGAGTPAASAGSAFPDVPSDTWYTSAIAWASSQGIVGGYGNGMFGPDDNITREQLAVMLWRHAGRPAPTNRVLTAPDAGQVSDYALDAVCWAAENRILNGDGGGRLNPQAQSTRAEAAQMLTRFFTNA